MPARCGRHAERHPGVRRPGSAVALAGSTRWFIFGMAPSSGMLSEHERAVVLDAIGRGMSVVNGLHGS